MARVKLVLIIERHRDIVTQALVDTVEGMGPGEPRGQVYERFVRALERRLDPWVHASAAEVES